MSTHTQYLVTIPQGVSFPRKREIAHQRCLLGFFFVRVLPTAYSPASQAPEPIFTRNTSNPAQGCAFSALENNRELWVLVLVLATYVVDISLVQKESRVKMLLGLYSTFPIDLRCSAMLPVTVSSVFSFCSNGLFFTQI